MCCHDDAACDCLGAGVSSLLCNTSSSEDGPGEEEESMSSTERGDPTGATRCDFGGFEDLEEINAVELLEKDTLK